MNNICLSVDLEFFYHTFAFQKSGSRKEDLKNFGYDGVDKILKLFKKYGVYSTFFTVGEIAETHPEIIERVVEYGHEIASHGLSHKSLVNILPKELEKELTKSKRILEKTSKQKIKGFRSPTLEINDKIIKIIEKVGYDYDSSFPTSIRIGNWYKNSLSTMKSGRLSEISNIGSKLYEFPVSSHPIVKLPISGFGIRFFGAGYVTASIKSLLKRKINPVIYFHPWEVSKIDKVKNIPWRVYFRTRESNLRRIEKIIKRFRNNCSFVPLNFN